MSVLAIRNLLEFHVMLMKFLLFRRITDRQKLSRLLLMDPL